MALGIGLELVASAVRAVVLDGPRTAAGQRPGGGPLTVLAAEEVPCETSNADTLTLTLAQLRRTLRIGTPVVLGVPSTSAILATVNPLVASPSRAGLAVQYELQQHLPFQLADAAWHYRWLSATNGDLGGGRPARANVGGRVSGVRVAPAGAASRGATGPGAVVAAMRRSLLEARLACCRRAGLTVQAVAINPVATLNAWCAQRTLPPTTGTVLLNLVTDRMAEWILWSPAALQVVPVETASPEDLPQELASSWEALRAQGGEVDGDPEQNRGLQCERA